MLKRFFKVYIVMGLLALFVFLTIPNNNNSDNVASRNRYNSVNTVDVPFYEVPEELYMSYPSQLIGFPDFEEIGNIYESIYFNMFIIPNYFKNDLGYFTLYMYPLYNTSHYSVDWVFSLNYYINRGMYFAHISSTPNIISYSNEYDLHMEFTDCWISSSDYYVYSTLDSAFLEFDIVLSSFDGQSEIEHNLLFTFEFFDLLDLNEAFESTFNDNSGGSTLLSFDDNYLMPVSSFINDYNIYVPTFIINDSTVVYNTFFYVSSYNEGLASGYDEGYQLGFSSGSEFGYYLGHNDGYQEGYQEGYNLGHNDGYQEGYNFGYEEGYLIGFGDAVDELNPVINSLENENISLNNRINSLRFDISYLENQLDNALSGKYTFSELFWSIGSIPFETIKSIWNFNFLGINLTQFFTGLITCLLLIYLIKKLFFK